jgi:hypothetical protein
VANLGTSSMHKRSCKGIMCKPSTRGRFIRVLPMWAQLKMGLHLSKRVVLKPQRASKLHMSLPCLFGVTACCCCTKKGVMRPEISHLWRCAGLIPVVVGTPSPPMQLGLCKRISRQVLELVICPFLLNTWCLGICFSAIFYPLTLYPLLYVWQVLQGL